MATTPATAPPATWALLAAPVKVETAGVVDETVTMAGVDEEQTVTVEVV